MAGRDKSAPEADERQGPVIRDKRRIDPETGEVREPSAEAASGEDAGATADSVDGSKVLELTADLQRVTAEYANYRKRVDRDRVAVREQAVANVLAEFLPMLDDIGRARDHGELTGGFKQVADAMESAVTKLGLVHYGEKGDPFDPNIHEALTHMYSPDVTETTCVEIFQPGYKVGDRILRPARVVVAEPGGAADGGDEPGDADASGGPEEQPAG